MFFTDAINKNNKRDLEDIAEFLKSFNIKYDFPEKTFVIRDKGEIISTGSIEGNVLKYFFTKCEYKGEGTISLIYNSILNYLMEKGQASFFIFTTPGNKEIFASLGLNLVYETSDAVLLEGGFSNYKSWIKAVQDSLEIEERLKSPEKLQSSSLKIKNSNKQYKYKRGSIVMNCNPMTLGHLYLIEKALEEVEELLIFLVEEDQSVFSFKDRWSILSQELEDYKRIKLIPSGPYIISRATFPTYFLKQEDDKLDIYTQLDAGIFGGKIAKDLEIDIRFLGSEPIDKLTRTYNSSLKKVLEGFNIDVKILDRKEIKSETISASKVRNLLSEGNIKQAYTYLSQSTIEFLQSEIGKDTINRLINLK